VKIEEIRALKDEELSTRIESAEKELFDLRLKLETKQLVNHREVPRMKKHIARLKTIIRERQLEIR
jgi:large subunit ribosomal protein L29